MSNVIAMAQKDVKSAISQIAGPAAIALFALVYGYFFVAILSFFVRQSVAIGQSGAPVNVNQMLVRPLLQNVLVLLLFLLPAITVHAAAGRSRTAHTALRDSPYDISGLIQKYAGAVMAYVIALGVTLIDITVLFNYGAPEWKPIVSAYFGLFLFGAGLIALGLFISQVIANKTAAYVATLCVFLAFWTFDWVAAFSEGAYADAIAYLSVSRHFDDFSKGVIDTSHVIFYLGLIALGIYLNVLRESLASSRSSGHGPQHMLAASGVFVALGIVAAANYVGARYDKRWDLTTNKQFTLSDQTRNMLRKLDAPLKIHVFAQEPEFQRYRDRLTEYEHVSKNIIAEYIDPDKKATLAKQAGVEQYGTIVVNYKGQAERITTDSEQDITNGIIKVVSGQKRNLYFTSGHGEHDTTGSERDGYNVIAAALGRENYGVEKLVIAQQGSVPDDASVVVVAGPKTDFVAPEIDALKKCLEKAGKLLLLLDPPDKSGSLPLTNLVALAHDWGMDVGNNVVVDVSGTGRLIGTDASVPVVASYPSHAITKNGGFNLLTAFPLARSVNPVSGGVNGHTAQGFIETNARSWAENDIKGLLTSGQVSLDEGRGDRKGPVTIGSAVSVASRATDVPPAGGVAVAETRVVVIGDSDFAANGALGIQGNRDLFMNIVGWVSAQGTSMSIPSKEPADRRLTLTAGQHRMVTWLALVIVPGLVLLGGSVARPFLTAADGTAHGLPAIGTPLFRGMAMSKMTDQSNRLLCASVFFNHGGARDTVIDWVQDPNRAVAPEPGIDLQTVVQVARFAQRRERQYWRLYFGVFVVALAGVLLTQAGEQNRLVLGVGALAVLATTVISARKQIDERNEFLPMFCSGRFDVRDAATRFNAELEAKERSALPAQEQNFFVYAGFTPFVGAGYDLGGWSIAVALDKPKERLGVAQPLVAFTAGELYAAIDRGVQALGLPAIEAKDCYFANGSDLKGDPALLPDKFARPVQSLDSEAAWRYAYASSDNEQVRHYRRYQIVDWGGELVLSYYLRSALRGNTLFVETKRFILTPIAAQFRIVDELVPNGLKEKLGVVAVCAVTAPFLLVGSPLWLLGDLSARFREWWGSSDKRRKTIIEKSRLFNYGADSSLRQRLSSPEYGHYFQKMDGDLFSKALEREVLDSLVTFLDERGIETSDLKERETTILNSGVIVHGGDVRAESIAVGAGSQASTRVTKVGRGKAGSTRADK